MMRAPMTSRVPSGMLASNTSSDQHCFVARMGRTRRSMGFLLSGVFLCATAAAANKPAARDGIPAEPSILEIKGGLAAGRFDVPALERHYEGRIHSIDRTGPHLNSVIEINPEAAKIAGALQQSAD